jgi:hypothetical protein
LIAIFVQFMKNVMTSIRLYTLYRGPYIDAFCQVWLHLAQLFQRSRLKYEKVNGQTTNAKWWQYLTWPFGSGENIYVRSSIKLLHLVPFGQQTWPLLLKIEHMVKLHVFCNNSKTINNIRNLTAKFGSICPSCFRGEY